MCGHCGCQGVDTVGELRNEHAALQAEAHDVRVALASGDSERAARCLAVLLGHLGPHVRREELGLFAALREQGDFADEVTALEGEHVAFHEAVDGLVAGAPDFAPRVQRLLDELDEHIEREDLGIFPVSVVTLGAAGWEVVDRAHEAVPSFLAARAPAAPR